MSLWPSIAAARGFQTYLVVPISGANDLTLSIDSAAAEIIELSGAITGNLNLILPAAAGDKGATWTIFNNTSGAFTITVKAATGTGIVVGQGKRAVLLWNGTNIVVAETDLASSGSAASGANADILSLSAITGGITASGGMNLGGALGGDSATPAPLSLARLSLSVAGAANVTLTAVQYANPILAFTGLLTGSINVFVPLVLGATWLVENLTTGAFTLTVIGATGTGIAVTQGKRQILSGDGVNLNAFAASI